MVPGPVTLQLSEDGSVTASGCASFGGSANEGRRRSSMSSIGAALASRYVSAGRFHFVSTSFRMQVRCETKSRRAQGEMSANGTRNPYLWNPSKPFSPACLQHSAPSDRLVRLFPALVALPCGHLNSSRRLSAEIGFVIRR
jgi:hypothetical protein